MATLAEQLDAYDLSLRQLVEALDAGAAPESVLQLSARAHALFEGLSAGLRSAQARERAQLAPKLEQARRWSAIASARCEAHRLQVAERLADVKLARQSLAAHAGLPAGGSCDIAG